ncbi:hypothetical protein [Candidatus Liberibacter africanus]|uniref:Lipoprotein n=1 Tax=Candidatus Liberibacter africanus PTSAPSY TaxID=1277257 RepID=A0A0G3I2H0_LIBAF|nr:hypothetical protein [Candidatus Liberibacter africanus]AKK20076.1 hypothetical protein G293_02220 [Candidatus Liberibacter africanus PTSAPSY]
MKGKKIMNNTYLVASVMVVSGLLASCDLSDEPKKLTPEQLCDAVCQLSHQEQQEFQAKVDQKYEEHLKTGSEVSKD